MPLKHWDDPTLTVAGTDEAGRGCLGRPVTAAAVILPTDYFHPLLNDSKQLSERQRETVRQDIEHRAISWAITHIWPERIDQINILWAAVEAMQQSVAQLSPAPTCCWWMAIASAPGRDPYRCIVKGDATYACIAAASILAKTERDRLMKQLAEQYPQYGWEKNKGYPSPAHRAAIAAWGPSPLHRRTFRLLDEQTQLAFPEK